MPGDNLKALFSPGRTPTLSAQQVFTNRVAEAQAFDASLSSFDLREAIESVDDLARGRRNVLMFYGTGGIGKTALSHELERRFAAGTKPVRNIRIDLDSESSLGVEMILLQLRVGLGQLAARWPAFDLVFASHWGQRHPDRSIDEVLTGSSRIGRLAKRVGITEQFQSALEEVSTDLMSTAIPVASAQRIGSQIFEQVRKAVQTRRLLANCASFEPLLESHPGDESASYMPALLAWDLAVHQRAARVGLPVVFIDNFELARTSDEREAQVQRLVFLLPNVLFVLTGRDRLTWAEASHGGHLDYVGPSRWPGLVASVDFEPRQHLLDYLSAQDCDVYLRSALIEDGEPAMPAEIRERVVTGSAGLPLYLDLAVSHFLAVRAENRPLEPQNFGGPLPAVISRAIRDLDREERQALFGASLFRRWDAGLAAAAGGVSDAAGIRLSKRPFVIESDDPLPLSLHSLLRDGIRAGVDLADAWSTNEWTQSADRALAALEQRWSQARDDWTTVTSVVNAAVDVAAGASQIPDWLLDAGIDLAEAGFWRALGSVSSGTEPVTHLDALATGLRGIAERRTASLAGSKASLEVAAAHPDLTERERDVFRLHLAHAVRNSGAYGTAQGRYEDLRRSPAVDVCRQATLQLADLHMLRGEFTAATALCDSLQRDGDATEHVVTEFHRLAGHIHRFNGDFARAAERYESARAVADRRGAVGEIAKALTNLAETAVWADRPKAQQLLDAAWSATTDVRNILDVPKLFAIRALLSEDPTELQHQVDAGLDACRESGYRSGEAFLRWAACHAWLRLRDRGRALDEYQRLEELTSDLDAYRFLPAIGGIWLGSSPDRFDEFDWLDGPAARAAWTRQIPGDER